MAKPSRVDDARSAAVAVPATARGQVRIADLIILVVAAALGFGVILRGARHPWADFPASLDRPLGLALACLAVFLAPVVGQEVIRAVRAGRAVGGSCSWAWSLAWRFLALASLVAVTATQISWFRDLGTRGTVEEITYKWITPLRLSLYPTAATLLIAGLVLGMRTAQSPRRVRRSAPRRIVAIVPLVVVIGVLASALASWIPYLVLIAVEFVYNATMRRPFAPRPGLWVRIAAAGWHALGATTVATLAAMYIDRDVRAARDEDAPWLELHSVRGIVIRMIVLLSLGTASGFLLLVTIPRLHTCLEEGLWGVFGAGEVVAVVAAFAGFTAGIMARAIAPATSVAPRVRPPVLNRVLGLVWPALGLAGLLAIIGSAAGDRRAVTGFGEPQAWAASVRGWSIAALPWTKGVWPWLRLDVFAWCVCLAWLVGQVIALVIEARAETPAAFDAVAQCPGRLVWFLWCWSALTVLCVAALPIFFVAGIVLLHLKTNLGDLLR